LITVYVFVLGTEDVSTFIIKVDGPSVGSLIFLIVFIFCTIIDDIFDDGLLYLFEKLYFVLQAYDMCCFLLKLDESVIEFRLENTLDFLFY
jgi:hypothetical protein